MAKRGLIYKHTNKFNGHSYIGSTTNSTNRRWGKKQNNYKPYKSCTVFHKALVKYGWEGFESEVLEDNIPEEQLFEREEYYIKHFNTLTPNGYNSVGILDGKVYYSDETRRKISEARKRHVESLDEPVIAVNRIVHIIEDGIEKKHCKECNKTKPLSDYGSLSSSWDGLARRCKECMKKFFAKHRDKKRLSEDQKKEIILRAERETNPEVKAKILAPLQEELKAKLEKSNKPKIAIYAKNAVTGKTIKFETVAEAELHGLFSSQIYKAIRNGTPYKGFYFSRAPF